MSLLVFGDEKYLHMKLHPEQAKEFLNTYKNILNYIFLQFNNNKIESLEEYQEARDTLFDNPMIIDDYISSNLGIINKEIQILHNIKNGIKDTFVYLKTLKRHSIFLRISTNEIFCVLGISDSIEDITPKKYSVIDTAIINFNGKIICDGLISHQNITIGKNMKNDINSHYKTAKENKQLIKQI